MSQDFNSTRAVVARKPHRCGECFRTIHPGETYMRVAGVWEGDFFTWTDCLHCHTAREQLVSRVGWDGMSYGGQCYGDEWDLIAEEESDPVWRARTYRFIACHKRRWTRRDGALMALPRAPHQAESKAVAS